MMDKLGDILKGNKFATPLVKGVRAAQVIAAAEKLLIEKFGEGIKTIAAPAYFKNQTLTIACLSSSAAGEIKLNEKLIIEELNRAVPYAQINKIRYLS